MIAALLRAFLCLASVALVAGAPRPAWGRPARVFAIVVGNNAPHRDGAPRLSFADDDAVRMYRLFATLPGTAVLLTRMDDDTRRHNPDLADRAQEPTAARLVAALDALGPELAGAAAAGWESALYFFFAGHGDRGEFPGAGRTLSYINLDRPVSSLELFELLDPVAADTRHVLIDACHSRDVVAGRGARYPDEPQHELHEVVGDFLSAHALRGRPGVGVFVSSTPERTALESPVLRGGVYTHVLRSGLLGAADIDGDGVVGYGEMEAFAEAAVLHLEHGQRMIHVFSEPPRGDRDAPLVDLRDARAPLLTVPPALQTRYTLRDPSGAAYADFHGAPELATHVLLVGPGPFDMVRWNRQGDRVLGEQRIEVAGRDPRTWIVLRRPHWSPQGTWVDAPTARGLQQLFRAAYGPALMRIILDAAHRAEPLARQAPQAPLAPPRAATAAAHVAPPGPRLERPRVEIDVRPADPLGPLGWTALGLAAGALVGAGVTLATRGDARDAYRACADLECRASARSRFQRYTDASTGLLVGGAALAAAGTVLLLYDHFDPGGSDDEGADVESPAFSAAPHPLAGGAGLGVAGHF